MGINFLLNHLFLSNAIAFFDLDGTLTKRDTLLEFTKYYCGTFRYALGLIILSPVLFLNKIGLIASHFAKEAYLSYFFKHEKYAAFCEAGSRFSVNILPQLIRESTLRRLMWHKEKGHEIVIVTASFEEWINAWAEKRVIKIISSKLEVVDQKIIGKIQGKNCKGDEKVKRVTQQYSLSSFTEIYAYGDSPSDKPLLNLATHPYYKDFNF